MSARSVPLRGIIPNIIVPLASGEIDFTALATEVRYLSAAGVHGIAFGGGLGELVGIDLTELRRVCECVRMHTNLPVAAILTPDVELEAQAMIEAVVTGGADAILVAQPHYLFQPDEDNLGAFFRRLRQATDRPLLLANIVSTAPVMPAVVDQLFSSGAIDGILQGCSDPHPLVDLLAAPDRRPVLCGIEELEYTSLLLGAEGVVSTMSTVFPSAAVALYNDYLRGDHEAARRRHESLLRLWRALDHPAEMAERLRCAVAAQGRNIGHAQPPFDLLRREMEAEVFRALKDEGGLASA